MYPLAAWLRYDITCSMALGLNKSLSWAQFDEYAYNRFIRNAPNTLLPISCAVIDVLARTIGLAPVIYCHIVHCLTSLFRTSHSKPQESRPCRYFNAVQCPSHKCKYSHHCAKCHGNTQLTVALKLRKTFKNLPRVAPTPINLSQLDYELRSCPDQLSLTYILSAFREGFDIGYDGPELSLISSNPSSAKSHTTVLFQNIVSELQQGRVIGPFIKPPLLNFCTSPSVVVPKKDSNKFCIITDLSLPQGSSINDLISTNQLSALTTSMKLSQLSQTLGKGHT